MTVQLVKRWQRWAPGDTLALPDSRAQWLIDHGIAQAPGAIREVETATVASAPETASVAPKPKRRRRKR